MNRNAASIRSSTGLLDAKLFRAPDLQHIATYAARRIVE